jgi:eukaryotic-like serine/threonine-protein kinase
MSVLEERVRQVADTGVTVAGSGEPLALLAHGPVATVYSVPHAKKPTALKVYPAKFDRRTLAAVEREQAKLRGMVVPARILLVDGIERMDDGRHALRMELCAQSLAALVERAGALPTDDVVVLGYALASALAVAHDAGIVHGGMAPANVLFRASGEPILADFGLRLREAFPRDPLHAIEFVSPETLRAGTVDERADLYGLGAVLHFALTGSSPHPRRLGEQPGERVLRVLAGPAPAVDRPGVPAPLLTVVASLMEVDPANRPPDAAQVAERLAHLLPRGLSAPPSQEAVDDFSQAPVEAAAADSLDDFDLAAPATPDVRNEPPAADDTAYEPPAADDTLDKPPAADDTVGKPRRRRLWRRYALAGGCVLTGLLVAVLMLRSQSDPDELRTTPRVPPPPVSPADTGPRTAVRLELADPIDRGDQVVLNWTSDQTLDILVVVAGEGEPNRYLFAHRNHTMTIPVDPVRKYCFLIQATDSNQVHETPPKGVRGAVCRK